MCIMDSEGVWTRIRDVEYPVAPILCSATTNPPHLPSAEEEAIALEYGCCIKEEDSITEDDEGTP